jgi:hypothetical protein
VTFKNGRLYDAQGNLIGEVDFVPAPKEPVRKTSRPIYMRPELGMGYGAVTAMRDAYRCAYGDLYQVWSRHPREVMNHLDKKDNTTMSSIRLTADSIGKKFNTRSGGIAEVISEHDPKHSTPNYVIRLESNSLVFTVSAGGAVYPGTAGGHGADLMSEHVPFKVEVGGLYKTRGGERVVVTSRNPSVGFNVRFLTGDTKKGLVRANHCGVDGVQVPGCAYEDDLVKRIKDWGVPEERAAAAAYRLADDLLTGRIGVHDHGVTYAGGGDHVWTETFEGYTFRLQVEAK